MNVVAAAVDMPTAICIHSSFFSLHKRIYYAVCISKLANLFLHCVLKNRLLLVDQSSLLFIIVNTFLIPPVPAPPIAPGMFSSGAAVGPSITTFLAKRSTFGSSPE